MEELIRNDDLEEFRAWYRVNSHVNVKEILERSIYDLIYYRSIKIIQELINVHEINIHEPVNCGVFIYTPLEIAAYEWYWNVNNKCSKQIILLLCQHGAYTDPLVLLSLQPRSMVKYNLIYLVQNMLALVRIQKIPKDIWRELKKYLY